MALKEIGNEVKCINEKKRKNLGNSIEIGTEIGIEKGIEWE